MSPRHGKEEPGLIERLKAQVAQLTAERDQAVQHAEAQGELLDQMWMASSLQQAAGEQTGPLRAVQDHPASRRASHRVPREKRWLEVVRDTAKGVIPAGGLAAFKPFSHALGYPLRHLAAASVPAKVTAAAGVTTLAVAASVAVVPHAASTFGIGASPAASAPAPGIWSATPIAGQQPVSLPSSQLRLAGAVTRPKTSAITALPFITAVPPRRSYTRVPAPGNPAPQPQQGPAWQGPGPQDPGLQQQPPAPSGPPVLQVDTASIDLSAGGSQVITLTASGDGGWISWSVSTAGSDLDFSATRGVLRAGRSATITVSVDPAQALDGNPSQAFSINGQQVTATLPPPPPPAPSPAATGTPTNLPAPLPS